jgi:hypothetical protein
MYLAAAVAKGYGVPGSTQRKRKEIIDFESKTKAFT